MEYDTIHKKEMEYGYGKKKKIYKKYIVDMNTNLINMIKPTKGKELKYGPIDIRRDEGSTWPPLIPGFCSMKQLGVFLLPLNRILVHCKLV